MILRVFPERTTLTPNDEYVRVGSPELNDPMSEVSEVHVSCLFTWMKDKAESLAVEYGRIYQCPVKIGGVAYKSPAYDFEPGKYIHNSVLFFSRGCPNNCLWCLVPDIEGRKIIELEPRGDGNIIQDNNIMAVSKHHFRKVCGFLKGKKGICFKGGIDVGLMTDWHIDLMRGLHIAELWLACDADSEIKPTVKMIRKLSKAGFSQKKIRVYCLIGHSGTLEQNESRCREVFLSGGLPFAMLFRDTNGEAKTWDVKWRAMQRRWCRPAIMRARPCNYRESLLKDVISRGVR